MATMTESGAAAPAKELVSLADTADLYATATGLMERSAAAFASGVPGGARDGGFFGPASVTWSVTTDRPPPVAGLRSLLIQALHPLAMAGVDQHSGWRRDPAGRLAATPAYLTTVTFGGRAAAQEGAGQARRLSAQWLPPGSRRPPRCHHGVPHHGHLRRPGRGQASRGPGAAHPR